MIAPNLRPSRPAALLAAVACVALARTAIATPCPDSELRFNTATPGVSSVPFTVDAAIFDTTLWEGEHLGFDLVSGRLTVEHARKFGAELRARDAFTLAGVAPGTPVAALLLFQVEGGIGTFGCGGSNCWGTITARITDGATFVEDHRSENLFGGPPRQVDFAVQLPVVLVSGEPREIEIALLVNGSNDHFEAATGEYRFLGLPPGASVGSCRGYVGVPTPVRVVSWGRLKAIHRR